MAVKRHKKSRFTVGMQRKLFGVFMIVVVSLIFLSGSIIKINVTKGKDYSKAVYNNYSYDSRVIPAKRGDITDRNGTILAYSTKVYNLILDTKILLSDDKYLTPTVEALLGNFEIEADWLESYIEENRAKKENGDTPSSYKRVITGLSYDEVSAFSNLMEKKGSLIKGVWFEDEYKRNYPYGTLACDALGFASEANGGELGIEKTYNSYLSGSNGRVFGYINNDSYESTIKEAVDGNTVVTTLDYTIQNIVETAIREFNEEYGSKATAAIVMDPNTGEILAMADYPTFDLNNPRDFSVLFPVRVEHKKEEPTEGEEDEEGETDGSDSGEILVEWLYEEDFTDEEKLELLFKRWSNYCVSTLYEPGSVFKTFIISEALEENAVSVNDTFLCDGEQIYDGTVIHCNHIHGNMTLSGTLANSCNDSLMQISFVLGKNIFAKYLSLYQFGTKTGIDLPGEEAGLVINYETAMDVDLATNAFGQNISVTMTQVMAGFCSLINGGTYYEPHMVREIRSESGDVIKKIEPVAVTQTISEDTSKNIRAMMRAVVEYGTAGYVYIPGYSIGGKTGTSEKAERDKSEYIVSFMGFFPVENPQVVSYVIIDAPQCERNDDSWAAQIISAKIFKEIIPYLGIERNNPDYEVDVFIDPDNPYKPVTKRPYTPPQPEEEPTIPEEEATEDTTDEAADDTDSSGTATDSDNQQE